MKEVQKLSLERAIRLLSILPCKFKVITDDGDEFGELEVKDVPKRKPLANPYGTFTAYIREHVKDGGTTVKVGDVVQIPLGSWDGETLRRSVSSYFSKAWGAGSHSSCITETHVEVFRTA